MSDRRLKPRDEGRAITAILLAKIDTLKIPDGIIGPRAAPKFAVRDDLETQIFLKGNDFADALVFDGLQFFHRERAGTLIVGSRVELQAGAAARFLQFLRAQIAPNDIGPEGRLTVSHKNSP